VKKLGMTIGVCALLLAGLMSPASTAQTIPFSDIHNSYAKEEIHTLYQQGIVKGDGNGRFYPLRPVTRAEFVTMLGRTLGLEPVQSPLQPFLDVPYGNWADGWVQAAAQTGLVSGTSPDTFAPEQSITRQEAAAILVRAGGKQTSSLAHVKLADQKAVASWALPYVKQAVASGLMTGYEGKFRPRGQLSRQELAVVLSRMMTVPASGGNKSGSTLQLAWQYGGTTQDFIRQVQQTPVNVLSPRWFFLDKSGNLTDSGDAALVKWARQNGKQVWPLVGNRFDAETTHQLLSSAERREAFAARILHLSEKYQLHGVNLDFENIKPEDRAGFTALIEELASVLRPKGVLLTVDVPPNLGTTWSEAYDYKELGRMVDYLVVMTYDEHWTGGPRAGSVSSLAWYTNHLRKITAVVPARKVIAGIPLYTRDWHTAGGKVHSQDLLLQEQYDRLAALKPRITWDAKSGQYIATYTQSGVTHTIWVEDSRSVAEKIRAARALGITGNAYWSIGGGTKDVWTAIGNLNKGLAK